MSGSNRSEQPKAGLIWTAVVIAVGVASYWLMFYDMGYQSGYGERKAQIEAQHYASDSAKKIERECGTKSGLAARECITKIVTSERESQRNESDLAAQWKAADWAMWAAIIAGAQLIATALGLYYVKRTLDATLEAVEDTGLATRAMERQNELAAIAQRPWVKLDARLTKLEVRDRHFSVSLAVDARNVGKSVAINAGLLAVMVQGDDRLGDAINRTRKKLRNPDMRTSPIIPGEALTIYIKAAYASDYVVSHEVKGQARFPLMIFAAVQYFLPGDPDPHITERAFAITEGEDEDPFGQNGIKLPISEYLDVTDLMVLPAGRTRTT